MKYFNYSANDIYVYSQSVCKQKRKVESSDLTYRFFGFHRGVRLWRNFTKNCKIIYSYEDIEPKTTNF